MILVELVDGCTPISSFWQAACFYLNTNSKIVYICWCVRDTRQHHYHKKRKRDDRTLLEIAQRKFVRQNQHQAPHVYAYEMRFNKTTCGIYIWPKSFALEHTKLHLSHTHTQKQCHVVRLVNIRNICIMDTNRPCTYQNRHTMSDYGCVCVIVAHAKRQIWNCYDRCWKWTQTINEQKFNLQKY